MQGAIDITQEHKDSMQLAKCMNVMAWADKQLGIIADMVEDRASDHFGDIVKFPSAQPINSEWLVGELRKIAKGLCIQ